MSAIRGLPSAGVGRPIFSPPCSQEELTEGLARCPGLPLGSLLSFVLFGALTRPSVVRVCHAAASPVARARGPHGCPPWPCRPPCLVSPHSHPSCGPLGPLPPASHPKQSTLPCLPGSPPSAVRALALLTTTEPSLQRVLSGSSATQ